MDTNKLMAALPDMAAFVTVVEEGSFTKASIKLGVTPSAVSRQVSRLEQVLSTKLLERTTRQLNLSSGGKEVFVLCKSMMESARSAVSASGASVESPSGWLRVAAPKAYARQVLGPLLPEFLRRYPDIQLKLKVTDHFIDPVSDEIDIIFRITQQPLEGLIAREVNTVRLIMCASPAYLEKYGEPSHPEELRNHECLFLGEQPRDNEWEFRYADQTIKITVNGRYAVNHTEMRLSAVVDGMGISVFPDFVIHKAIEEGRVKAILKDWSVSGNYQGAVVMQYAQSKFIPSRMKVFVNYILESHRSNDD